MFSACNKLDVVRGMRYPLCLRRKLVFLKGLNMIGRWRMVPALMFTIMLGSLHGSITGEKASAACFSGADAVCMIKQGEAILADTQVAVVQASEFFKVRGMFKRFSHRVSQFDTGEALIATGAMAAILAGIAYGAPKVPWESVGQSLLSGCEKIGQMGTNGWITVGIVGLAATVFLALEAHSDAAYCWSAIRMMDALSYELVLDDFFADRVADSNIRAYIIANFDPVRPVLAAVRHYQKISIVLNTAQEMLTKSARSSNPGIVQQSRTFLDLLRRFEGQIERKLEYIYRVMGHEYELEKIRDSQIPVHHDMHHQQHAADFQQPVAEPSHQSAVLGGTSRR